MTARETNITLAWTDEERVLRLFDACMDVNPAERSRFADASGETPEIIAQVKTLLGSLDDAKANDFMASTALEELKPASRIGDTVGHYRIIRQLGEGGMGAVYLAERADKEFKQQVAIKLIRSGFGVDEIIRRFRQERQILAGLDHPNIARLIDGGTTSDGLPYLVMEHVDGRPLDDHCSANGLDLKSRLELFRKVCSAVDYAHRKLILHRDLKPSNILVTADGEPKLLDFGIAKLFSDDKGGYETITLMPAFTPGYASPEQLRGEQLTTAADVYSLGVILHELLTGELPFDLAGKTLAQLISTVTGSEPRPPSEKTGADLAIDTSALKGDLDNIILKSLRKEPERRYHSVADLSEDLRRYQTGMPVGARPDTVSYRTRKFIRRNRIAVGGAMLIVLAIFSGVIATLWQAQKARAERAKAEHRFNDVRTLVNTLLQDLNTEMEKLPGSIKSRQLLVERTLDYLDSVSREAEGDASLMREMATGYTKIGDIQGNPFFSNIGNTQGAVDSYAKALEIRKQLVAASPDDPKLKQELAQTYESIGDVVYDLGNVAGRYENYARAASIMENIVNGGVVDNDTRLYLAQLYASLADAKYKDGDPSMRDLPGALDEQAKAIAIREPLAAANPEDRKINMYLNQSYFRLSVLYRLKGDYDGSLDFLKRSQAIVEKFMAKDPDNINRKRDTAICFANFGTHYAEAGDLDDALSFIDKSIALRESVSAADPTDTRAKRDTGYGYGVRGTALLYNNAALKALEQFQKQVRFYEELAAASGTNRERQRDLVEALVNRAKAKIATGDAKDALSDLDRARGLNSELSAEQSARSRAQVDALSGVAQMKLGQTAEAIRLLESAREAMEADVAADPLNAISRAELARLYVDLGEVYERTSPDAARTRYARAVELFESLRSNNMLRAIDRNKYETALSHAR